MIGRQFLRFAVVGLANTVVDFGLFWLLTSLVGWPYPLAHGLAYVLATVNSYLGNRFWAFAAEARAGDHRQPLRFMIVNLTAFGLSFLGLTVAHELGGLPVLVAKALAIAVSVGTNFMGNRFWVFRSAPGQHSA